jgi:L-lactate dehydrogenase (cytochrome)
MRATVGNRALSLCDFEDAARRRLPRALFGYVSGGVETDLSLRFNAAAFDRWAFRPRVLTDISERDASTEIFGKRYAAPFGIAPMGGIALGWTDGDNALAKAGATANIPFILSGASCTCMEEIRVASRSAWFQAYLPPGETEIAALVDRVATSGYEVLVITVDVPVVGNRENNQRLGFSLPLRPSPRLAIDGLSHPRWLCGVFLKTLLTRGMPHFENQRSRRGASVFTARAAGVDRAPRGFTLTWAHIDAVRRQWSGKLVIKGLLDTDDARRAAACGVDGLIVSNHGGRQLDGAVAPLDALPDIVAAVPGLTVMMDGGIRRGTHVLKALALGARCVFVGRPMFYAVAAGGLPSAQRAIRLLADEIDRDMAFLGAAKVADIDRSILVRS